MFRHPSILLDLGFNPWSFTSLAVEIKTILPYLQSCYIVSFSCKGHTQKHTNEHRKRSSSVKQVWKGPWSSSCNSREKKAPDCLWMTPERERWDSCNEKYTLYFSICLKVLSFSCKNIVPLKCWKLPEVGIIGWYFWSIEINTWLVNVTQAPSAVRQDPRG